MKMFCETSGTAVPLDRADVDTDAIIPQRWLITTERDGIGAGFFFNWRYPGADGVPDHRFVLNQPRFASAKILVAGPNYGCGSSREHAVWAHLDYGIEAVIAPSFGPIFYDNALKNGLVAVRLDEATVGRFLEQLLASDHNRMRLDLARCEVEGPDGSLHGFEIDDQRRAAILAGVDDIAATLRLSDAIDEFQADDRVRNPWAWANLRSQGTGGEPEMRPHR
jgi:3-isopropylmalate/(R)-2-methylmalate dehydratase small subunit